MLDFAPYLPLGLITIVAFIAASIDRDIFAFGVLLVNSFMGYIWFSMEIGVGDVEGVIYAFGIISLFNLIAANLNLLRKSVSNIQAE